MSVFFPSSVSKTYSFSTAPPRKLPPLLDDLRLPLRVLGFELRELVARSLPFRHGPDRVLSHVGVDRTHARKSSTPVTDSAE